MPKASANKTGSTNAFDQNWRNREEAFYNHWSPNKPVNQIQLAFYSHWKLFLDLLKGKTKGKCLEVGCGRGTISSYFAENGFDCTLTDISPAVLDIAEKIFDKAGHKASFIEVDANDMPFHDGEFDVIVNIGLIEHFENVETVIDEHIRVLKKDGLALCYIVPEFENNVQYKFNWINSILKVIHHLFKADKTNKYVKANIYRNTYMPDYYLSIMKDKNVYDADVVGMYPLPMVSYSPEFPFTLLPPALEKILVYIFKLVLSYRKFVYRKNPWTCNPLFGQAFLLVFRKKGKFL